VRSLTLTTLGFDMQRRWRRANETDTGPKNNRICSDAGSVAHVADAASFGINQQNHPGFRRRGFLSMAINTAARRVGATHPDQVLLVKVQKIPIPRHPALITAGEATSLISPFTIGLTLRYGIFIRDDYGDQRRLVVHELAYKSFRRNRLVRFLEGTAFGYIGKNLRVTEA
jgi:hypothetical protein